MVSLVEWNFSNTVFCDSTLWLCLVTVFSDSLFNWGNTVTKYSHKVPSQNTVTKHHPTRKLQNYFSQLIGQRKLKPICIFVLNVEVTDHQGQLCQESWSSPSVLTFFPISEFSYFVIRFLNHISFVINFSYFIIRFYYRAIK